MKSAAKRFFGIAMLFIIIPFALIVLALYLLYIGMLKLLVKITSPFEHSRLHRFFKNEVLNSEAQRINLDYNSSSKFLNICEAPDISSFFKDFAQVRGWIVIEQDSGVENELLAIEKADIPALQNKYRIKIENADASLVSLPELKKAVKWPDLQAQTNYLEKHPYFHYLYQHDDYCGIEPLSLELLREFLRMIIPGLLFDSPTDVNPALLSDIIKLVQTKKGLNILKRKDNKIFLRTQKRQLQELVVKDGEICYNTFCSEDS